MVARSSSIFFVISTEANSWYNLSGEEPLMAPVIANSALYCSDSILFENDALDGWS